MLSPKTSGILFLCGVLCLSQVVRAGPAEFLADKISGIDTSRPGALADILEAQRYLDYGRDNGLITPEQGGPLQEAISDKYDAWLRSRLNEIDPAQPGALKDFFDLQNVAASEFHDDLASPEAKADCDRIMREKFNQWVRARVDEIDPADPAALKDFFDLQQVQQLDKYDEFVSPETDAYRQQQMGEKFNQWVRNRVDDIDPAERDLLDDFYALQTVQATEKYAEYATADTTAYKEQQMGEKFNQWVRNLVDGLDPSDPDFLAELEELRRLQTTDKYDRFATPETHAYKEAALQAKYGTFLSNLITVLPPLPTDLEQLARLLDLMRSETYELLCPQPVKIQVQNGLYSKLTHPPGDPPQVTMLWPQDGKPEIGLLHRVLIAFDQSMQIPTVDGAVSISPEVPCTSVWTTDFILQLEHQQPFAPGSLYTVTVGTGATALNGLTLPEPVLSTFTTRALPAAPQILGTAPADGDANASTAHPLTITFDQPMDRGSLGPAVGLVPQTALGILWDAAGVIANLQPLAPLLHNTSYRLDIGTGARSLDGVPLASTHGVEFITGLVDRPVVLGSQPADGALRVDESHPVAVTFDRSMDPASVEGALLVTPAVLAAVSWTEANFVLHLRLATDLPDATSVTIAVGTGARSAVGLPLAQPFSFSFETFAPGQQDWPDGGADSGEDLEESDAGADGDQQPDAGADDVKPASGGCGCGSDGSGLPGLALLLVVAYCFRKWFRRMQP